MKYSVIKHNEFFFDIYIKEFNLMRIDLENIDIDIPASGPLNISERQVHKAVKNIMAELSGTWYLGELRITDPNGNYARTDHNVTRTDLNDSEFSPNRVLIAENGNITISKF